MPRMNKKKSKGEKLERNKGDSVIVGNVQMD
jgi:hypothetical protein